MISPVSHPTQVQAQAAAQSADARQPAPAPRPVPPVVAAKSQSAVSDTVQISAATRSLQETLELPAQTAWEARSGDVQAARLLARQAAAQAVRK